jgi:hypothetical protein
MIARIVTISLRPGGRAEFAKAIDKRVIPPLHTHKGFLDEIALVTSDCKIGFGISFWDGEEGAEAYNRSGYSEVIKALEPVVDGSVQLQLCEVTNSTAHKIVAGVGA